MNIASLADRLLLANALVACAAYSAAERNPVVFALFVLVSSVGWWVTGLRSQRPLPKAVSGFLVFSAIAWSAYRVMGSDGYAGLTVSVFCEFLLMILAIKFWDRRAARDMAQLLTLSVFLSVGAMLTSNSLFVGALLVLNVATLVTATTTFHIAATDERSIAPRTDPSAVRAAPTPIGLWQLGTLHGVIVVLGLAISVAVWFTMPRGIGLSKLGRWGEPTGGRQTGFTDRVNLRRSGLISESSRQVMEVEFQHEDGTPLSTEGQLFYMRGAVLDSYRNGSWTEDVTNRSDGTVFEEAKDRVMIPIPGVPTIAKITQRVTVREASGRRTPLMCLYQPFQVRPDSESTITINNKTKTILRDGRAGRFSYLVTSGTPTISDPDEVFKHKVVDPASTERVRSLARSILREAGIDADPSKRSPTTEISACRAIERHLREKYSYTLDTPVLPSGADPIDAFLFQTKAAHCEFFASAMAAMCRAVGINARVIAGYVVGEYDEQAKRFIVRESNAHAWVEAQVSPDVWRTFDPTPPDTIRRQVAAPSGPLAAISRWFDALDDKWSNSVVTFDESSRSNLLGKLAPDSEGPRFGAFTLPEWLARLAPSESWRPVVASAIIAASILAIWLALRAATIRLAATTVARWEAGRRRKAESAIVGPQGRFYNRILNSLRKRRLEKPWGTPPLRHADSLSAAHPEIARNLKSAAHLYYKLRFGRRPLSDTESRAAETHTSALEP